MTTLNELAKEINKVAKEKGFYEDGYHISSGLMLIVSELSEALDADRKGDWVRLNETTKMNISGQEDETFKDIFEQMYVKDSFEDEIADALIRILDLCYHFNIDIEWHVRNKTRYNKLREFKHGKNY